MKKAITMSVTLRITGDDPGPNDFVARCQQAVRDVIQAGSAKHPDLDIKVTRVGERGHDD